MACSTAVVALSVLSALVLSSSAAERALVTRDVRADSNHARLRGGAEVGKGDPRWIVSEREDGKNVGAWHWEERDMLPFAKKQLQGILGLSSEGKNIDGKYDVSMRVDNITRLHGDAVIHLRKGKMWPLCDLQLAATVQGECVDKEGKSVTLKGEIVFEEITMDDRDDLQNRVSVIGSGAAHDAWLRWFRKEGKNTVIAFVQSFLGDLDKQATNAQQEAAAGGGPSGAPPTAKEAAAKMAQVNKVPAPPPPTDSELGGGATGVVQISEEFAARCEHIFEALTAGHRINAYTRCSDSKSEAWPGGRFSLFSGHITGGYEEIVAPEFIKGKWRMADWQPGLFSNIRIVLHELGEHDGCRLELSQDHVPAAAVKAVERQWRITFGYGPVTGGHRSLFSAV